MTLRRAIPTLILLAALPLAGCASRSDESSVSTTERAEYETSSARRLAAARAGLDSLTVEAKDRADTTRARVASQLLELEVKRQEAGRELEALRASSVRRWREMKNEMADMLANLEAGMDSLRVRLER